MAESGAELRARVREHVAEHPMLTVFEIARALGYPFESGGQGKVLRQLRLLEGEGEVRGVAGPRSGGDRRPTVRWTAT